MRGYFGIGVETISKPMNAGNLFRSAHAFGASFVFAVDPQFSIREAGLADTSCAANNVPLFEFDSVGDMELPAGCELVGVELVEDAVSLPSFRHPRRCAYVLGPERGNLSDAMLARCRHVVKIPTKFCINVGVAGAIVMYDRQLSLGRFAERPVAAGGNMSPLPPPVHGRPVLRTVGRRGGSET